MTNRHNSANADTNDPGAARAGTQAVRVLAIASAGGHWVQLQRLRPAWDGCQVAYVTTQEGYRSRVMAEAEASGQLRPDYYVVPDANRWQKIRLVWQMLKIAAIFIKVRPHAIISTGAAPGYFAIRFGRLIGARTIWVDSIANAEELSLSGQRVGPHADIWLTQWPHLASSDGPHYEGSVL